MQDNKVKLIVTENELFKNKTYRINMRYYSALIMLDDEYIGITHLNAEKQDHELLFLDMKIDPEYRGKGYGKQALERISNLFISKMILANVEKDNIAANKAIEDIGILLTTNEDKNVYLLQKKRYIEFLEEGYMTLLDEHLSTPCPKRLMLQDQY